MKILFCKYINKFILFLYVTIFLACSGNDITTTGKTIGFECQTKTFKSTKAITDDMQYFRVSAIWNKGDSRYESFMNNQLVERQGENWVYSPVRYWPVNGSVSFFAYSPATSSGLQSFNISNTDNKVTIDYEMPNNGEHQEDFLVATALDKTDNPARLQFEHVLANVKFWAKTIDTNTLYRINKITLKNLHSTGTLTGTAVDASTKWTWNGMSNLTNYEVYQKYAFEVSTTYNEVGAIMVLPQVISNNFEIEITYNDTEKIIRTLNNNFEFEMGKKYSFYLEID